MSDQPGGGFLERLRWPAIMALVILLVAAGALAVDQLRTVGQPSATTVEVVAPNGTVLGTVHVRIADTFRQRYIGLSNTKSLGPNEGMLFIHDHAGSKTYVMRDMAFPIDIVFVGADGRITTFYHAPTEPPPYHHYTGQAKWVLEVPYHWTTRHAVQVGDELRIGTGS